MNYNISNKNNFFDILPKIYLNNKTIPSLKDIFESRQLFIENKNITKEYINFIRPINETKEKEINKILSTKNIKYISCYYKNRNNQLDYKNYGQLCMEEKLLNPNEMETYNSPLISVVVASFNKEKMVMKSLRSIQNQSLKNIEIIIVDDCSTDNSYKYYNYLLKTDSRIRIFYHLENMGVWRTRLDGFLYSKGNYIIHFDGGDLYEDNYVLEDAYNIAEKNHLDSVKMTFRILNNYSNWDTYKLPFILKRNYSKIIYNSKNILRYNSKICGNYTNIWNRLIRSDIVLKGLNLLNSYILNIYKNLWEDIWWNRIVDKVSYNYAIINRFSYLYFKDGTGEGTFKIQTEVQKDRMIQEFIYFLYFNLQLLPKRYNKNNIIKRLKELNDTLNVNLKDFKTKFYILDNLLNNLISDHFVSINSKIYLYKLLKESKVRQKRKYYIN